MHVSVLQEAVSTGDPELVQLVLQYRDFKRATERLAGIPELLSKLRQVRQLRTDHSLTNENLLCHYLRYSTEQPNLKHCSNVVVVVDFLTWVKAGRSDTNPESCHLSTPGPVNLLYVHLYGHTFAGLMLCFIKMRIHGMSEEMAHWL